MKRTLISALCAGAVLITCASARTWTDNKGRKIEADLLRIEGDKAILKFKGREVKYPITKLSEQDQDFITKWQEKHKEDAVADTPASIEVGELTLCGTTLKADGSINVVEEPLRENVLKKYSRASDKPTQLKIAIALPENFDPSKPQHVMWVSAAINSEEERKSGNIKAMDSYKNTAVEAGWVVIAADTDLGNPRLEDNQRSNGGDLAVHTQAIASLSKAFPGFPTWKFACCGHSGGAKASFYRMGDLLDSKLQVVGLYLSGCNQDMTADAREETGFRKNEVRKIKVYISNGREDDISTVNHAESLKRSIRGNRYGDIRLELFDGGHRMMRGEFKKAMEWFAETGE